LSAFAEMLVTWDRVAKEISRAKADYGEPFARLRVFAGAPRSPDGPLIAVSRRSSRTSASGAAGLREATKVYRQVLNVAVAGHALR
jgi:hypothetical protein